MSHAWLVGFSEQKDDLVRTRTSEFGGLSLIQRWRQTRVTLHFLADATPSCRRSTYWWGVR
jgi:hypothetical protein